MTLFCVAGPVLIQAPENATVLAGQHHTFHCQTSGDLHPKVTWQRYHTDVTQLETLQSRGRNYRVLRSGRLRLRSVTARDSGHYMCIVESSLGKIRSNLAYLYVQGQSNCVATLTDNGTLIM